MAVIEVNGIPNRFWYLLVPGCVVIALYLIHQLLTVMVVPVASVVLGIAFLIFLYKIYQIRTNARVQISAQNYDYASKEMFVKGLIAAEKHKRMKYIRGLNRLCDGLELSGREVQQMKALKIN